MLGWKKGLKWKISIKSCYPSMAACMDPPDEIQESVDHYEVVDERDGYWQVKIGERSTRYELWYFKEPLALHKVVLFDTTRDGKVLQSERLVLDEPQEWLDPIIGKQFPFIADFPVLTDPPRKGEVLKKRIGDDENFTEFFFEEGRPYWTNAKKVYRSDYLKFEAWLVVE